MTTALSHSCFFMWGDKKHKDRFIPMQKASVVKLDAHFPSTNMCNDKCKSLDKTDLLSHVSCQQPAIQ